MSRKDTSQGEGSNCTKPFVSGIPIYRSFTTVSLSGFITLREPSLPLTFISSNKIWSFLNFIFCENPKKLKDNKNAIISFFIFVNRFVCLPIATTSTTREASAAEAAAKTTAATRKSATTRSSKTTAASAHVA